MDIVVGQAGLDIRIKEAGGELCVFRFREVPAENHQAAGSANPNPSMVVRGDIPYPFMV